jgi:hypothetical protein
VLSRKILEGFPDVAKLLGYEIVQHALLRVDRKLCSGTCTRNKWDPEVEYESTHCVSVIFAEPGVGTKGPIPCIASV